ncbi:TetR/AcrR family transcriptional regulator [Paenibacillus riograndensis]|uniref:TetR family transcriptional regulator n=1 Tax=Paenibacillus riograndensis SBR5 TaxID=1073571 RepID=A0A0E4CW95_9BACL|nr:TetR/AcrR family transcriptional regulator [Paenibacillus riograndensis]CQR55026.1 TetR family transcriptional regulator [Paenibacillus riograndensis SBR5]
MEQNLQIVSPMSNQGRNAYVTERLTNTLLVLLRDKPISDISISELCEGAGVGRVSFYRNYTEKEDILKAYIDLLFQSFMDEYHNYSEGIERPLSDLIRALFTHIEDHLDFYRLLNERGLVYLLKDVVVEICGLKPESSKIEAYSKAFVAYTLYGWVEVWFQRGMKESATEMADMFKNLGL